ncbi:MAG: hypothetical protein ACR2K2_14440 [Mycobacteriales bacterium]
MSDTSGSPKATRLAAPGWLDGRLVLGVLLVLVSVVVGARVLSSADRSQLVWATTGDLAVGSQLADADLTPVRVRLFDSVGRYLDAARPPPVGYTVRRALGAGELLPQDALSLPEDGAFRLVTVPLEAGHFPPDLADEQEVDVWVTPERAGSAAPAAGAGVGPLDLRGAQVVLRRVAVATGPPEDSFSSGGTASPVVLRVKETDVGPLVSAMSLGRLDLVRVPRNAEASVPPVPATGAG